VSATSHVTDLRAADPGCDPPGVLFTDRLRLAVRRGWDRVDATLIDSRLVERSSYNVQRSNASYQVWEYMVEVPGPAGSPVRLAFKEKTFNRRSYSPCAGSTSVRPAASKSRRLSVASGRP